MVAAQVESPAIERARLAREAMAECNNNRVQAIALYQRWLDEDPLLAARLTLSFVEDGIATDIAGVDATARRTLRMVAIRSAPDHPSQKKARVVINENFGKVPNPDRAAAHLQEIYQRQQDDPDFHRWPLPGGKFLGEATPADVLMGAKFYGESAHTSRVNQRFLELVYEAMQGGSCVQKVLSHAALLRLRRRAEDGE